MVEFLSSEWKTKKEILHEAEEKGIIINERAWRLYVENYNKKYITHEHDDFIAHSKKGYKLTSDKQEIIKSLKDNHKRSINMLWKESQALRAMGEKDNLRMELEELEMI